MIITICKKINVNTAYFKVNVLYLIFADTKKLNHQKKFLQTSKKMVELNSRKEFIEPL